MNKTTNDTTLLSRVADKLTAGFISIKSAENTAKASETPRLEGVIDIINPRVEIEVKNKPSIKLIWAPIAP